MNDDDYAPDEMDLSRWDRQDREDDAAEAEAKRRAVAYSPEQLSLQEALLEGRRAGLAGRPASMNPNQDFTPEFAEWEKGRMQTLGQYMENAA